MNCIIVDDEEVSRMVIRDYIDRTEWLTCESEYQSAIEAFRRLEKGGVDLVFLDVEMPKMSGIELIDSLDSMPQIIMTTGKDQYAVKAFDYGLTDYLLKPITYPRFLAAVKKARQNLSQQVLETQGDKDIYVKADSKVVRIKLQDIFFLEALSDYVIINTLDKKYIVHSTMKGIEKKLPTTDFVRVHRSYIINIKKIESIEDTTVMMPSNKVIPIGASYRNDFLSKLNFL
jgi:DNA-binding LytR/AlgR family response regulator